MSLQIPLTHVDDLYNNSLIAHYTMNANGNDSTSNGNNLSGSPGFIFSNNTNTPGPPYQARSVRDPTSGYWGQASVTGLTEPSTTGFTVAYWMYSAQTGNVHSCVNFGYGSVIGSGSPTSDTHQSKRYVTEFHPPNLYHYIQFTGGQLSLSNVSALNTWAHVVLTVDSNNVCNLYLNGSLDETKTGSGRLYQNWDTVSVGYNPYQGTFSNQYGFEGFHSDVRIYNTVLTSTQVTSLYTYTQLNATFPTTSTNVTIPTNNWNFLVSGAVGDIIYDNISNDTATYESGFTSDATNGATSNINTARLRIATGSLSFHSSFSMELLVRMNTTYNYHQLFYSHSGGGVNGAGLYCGSSTSSKLNFFVANSSGNLFTSNTTGTYTGSALSMDGSTYYHIVCVLDGANDSAYIYQDGAKVWEQTSLSLSESDFPITPSTYVAIGREQQVTDINIKTFRVWENYALTETNVGALYRNSSADVFLFSNLRLQLGDVALSQNLNKTLADYRTENIPLIDVSFAAFPINKFKETYVLGDVDISGDTILRSNTTFFTDISADTFDVSGNLLISDLSANSRLFVGGDVSFNSNVTIQGDLSFGSDISFNGTFTRAQAGIGTGSGLLMNTDFSMNATLEFNGATTIKNDLHFNAYSDVSANPVLTDGTLLHNQKMEKLDHRYLLDISMSSPFSTLNYNTLPSNIYDNSTNSGICISGDGKYIRTVNSSDVSANALSYYSEDYGSSFQVDNELSNKLSLFDVSMNSLDDYHPEITPGATYTNEPEGTTGLWTGSGTTSASFTHSSGTYSVSSNSTLDSQTGQMYNVANIFTYSTGSSTAAGHAMNRTGWNSSNGSNLWRHSSYSLTAYDANNSATTYNGDYITVTTPYFFKMTQIGFANHWAGNLVNKFMVIGEDSTSTKRVLLSETSHGGSVGSYTTFSVSTDYLVNKFYLHITEINSGNQFTGIRKLRWNGIKPVVTTQELRPIFGSDKVFMSYNGQHQLVPKGISNKLTFDDFLYVSNNFGKNWTLRKNNTISTTTYAYTVTANGTSNYILNGGGFSSEAQPAVSIYLNESTEFTIDSTTNGNHPFKIGTSENDDEITDSRITSVTSGSNQVITFKPTNSGTFYYYCSAHSGMGSSINVIEPAGRFSLDSSGSTWFWNTGAVSADGKHMYVSGKTGLWKSQDFGNSWYQASSDSSFNYMSISADGKQVYGVNERKVYGSTDYGNTFSTLYTDSSTTDLNYAGISTSGNGKYITIADVSGSNIYMSSNYGNSFDLEPLEPVYVEDSGIPTAAYDWDFRVATPSDNIVKDSIAGLNATYVSGVTSTVSAGAYFSGATRSEDASPHINLDAFPVGGGYSFEVYVKFDSTASYTRILDFGDANGSNYNNLLLARSATTTEFYWGINSGTPFTNGTIVNGVLTHIVAILSTTGAETLYQDGVLVNETGSTTNNSVSSRSNNYLGRSNWYNDAAFEGNIQFFRVYNSELSSSDVTKLYENIGPTAFVNNNINCGMSHSGKIVLNSNYISYDYGNNFHFIPHLISNQLTNNDTFYSKANMEYLLDTSNNLMLSIPYKSAQFQDIYSVGSIKVGTTTYSSDYRIKENVEELGEEDTVNELRPVKYYNTNLKRDDYGLIAHELQEKYPFLVSGEKDGPEPQSINYNGLISLLVHEIKNLKKEYLELQEMKK